MPSHWVSGSILSLVEQLDGTIELDRCAGTAFMIVVKGKEYEGPMMVLSEKKGNQFSVYLVKCAGMNSGRCKGPIRVLF